MVLGGISYVSFLHGMERHDLILIPSVFPHKVSERLQASLLTGF